MPLFSLKETWIVAPMMFVSPTVKRTKDDEQDRYNNSQLLNDGVPIRSGTSAGSSILTAVYAKLEIAQTVKNTPDSKHIWAKPNTLNNMSYTIAHSEAMGWSPDGNPSRLGVNGQLSWT